MPSTKTHGGARLFNAVAATARPALDFTQHVDTVTLQAVGERPPRCGSRFVHDIQDEEFTMRDRYQTIAIAHERDPAPHGFLCRRGFAVHRGGIGRRSA